MNTIKRPALGRSWYTPSHVWAASYLLYAVVLFMLPGWGSYQVAMHATLPLAAKVPLIVLLTVLSGYGLNMMGFVGHEGTHGSLFRNRKLSALTGIFFASAVPTYFEMGFAVSHWNHHRYTNQDGDPDPGPVMGLKTWWQRLLFTRPIYNTLYFKHTLELARGKETHFKYKMAYSQPDQVLFARANFVFALLWLAAYVAVLVYDWRLGVLAVVLPSLTVNFIGACQIYIDHAGVGSGVFNNAWSRTSPLMTILFFGANYHLEHHAYPGIPCYRLPALARWLRASDTYGAIQPPVQRGFLGAFVPLTLPYVINRSSADFDAFRSAAEDTESPLGDAHGGRNTAPSDLSGAKPNHV